MERVKSKRTGPPKRAVTRKAKEAAMKTKDKRRSSLPTFKQPKGRPPKRQSSISNDEGNSSPNDPKVEPPIEKKKKKDEEIEDEEDVDELPLQCSDTPSNQHEEKEEPDVAEFAKETDDNKN